MLTGRRRKYFVHPSPPTTNRTLYQRHFEFGVHQARGVCLDVFCFVGGQACCYVWFPEYDVAASEAMFADHLRYCYTLEGMGSQRGFQAERASSFTAFFIRRVWSRLLGESPMIQELPSRSDLQSNPNDRNA